jgi:putative addiction module killer protein
MFTVKTTAQFDGWLNSLKDKVTVMRLKKRLDKASRGLLGDIKPVGNSIVEMREFFGSGYRMYYIQQGDCLIVMLGGGDKSTQSQDIEQATQLVQQLEE